MTFIFSCCYWLFFAVSSAILFCGAVAIWAITVPFDPTRKLLHYYTCAWAVMYVRCLPGCRVRVENRHKIRPKMPYVLVANHQSSTDIMALSALFVPFKWVSKKENFRIPFIGWNAWLNATVRVDRGNVRGVDATMARCRQWLKLGVPLMMFPEGHRSRTGMMQKFHGGSFKLAVDCDCAVVPIVVDGTLPIYQGFRVKAFPGTITIRVLDPITPAEVGNKALRLRDLAFEHMVAALASIRGQRGVTSAEVARPESSKGVRTSP